MNNIKPGQLDFEKLQLEVNLHAVTGIAAAIKFNRSRVFQGNIAKKGHIFIKTSCSWRGKNHWKVREVNISTLNDSQLKDMFEQMKDEMLKQVATYLG